MLQYLKPRYFKDRVIEYLTKGNKATFVAPKNIGVLNSEEQVVVDQFHDLYYRKWQKGHGTIDISWMGFRTLKCPLDLWIYQEIIFETKPDVIIECGTFLGGSALYLSHLLDILKNGEVISIDLIQRENLPQHPRISYVTGSSTSEEVFKEVSRRVQNKKVMVILDSDHSKGHVFKELELYHQLVSKGCYLIVEDSNINGHPTNKEHGPGPWEAVEFFLSSKGDLFKIDKTRERFLMTLNPNGYLVKI